MKREFIWSRATPFDVRLTVVAAAAAQSFRTFPARGRRVPRRPPVCTSAVVATTRQKSESAIRDDLEKNPEGHRRGLNDHRRTPLKFPRSDVQPIGSLLRVVDNCKPSSSSYMSVSMRIVSRCGRGRP